MCYILLISLFYPWEKLGLDNQMDMSVCAWRWVWTVKIRVCVCVWGGGGGGEVGICKIVLQSSPQAQLFFLN